MTTWLQARVVKDRDLSHPFTSHRVRLCESSVRKDLGVITINNNNNNNYIYFYSANSTIQFSNVLHNSRRNQINIAQIIIFTIIIHKSNQIKCWFLMRGKPEYPGENLS